MNGSRFTMSEVESYLAFANRLADSARPLALSYFRAALDVESKADDSPVTIADREISGCITDWHGNKLTIDTPGEGMATSSPRLHDEALRLLNSGT